ncbi:MAG: FHA domain-containing protein [Bdellovibrio sp.]|nr:FHA domain-containing protein [Bdellovibrio sp.]
MGMKLSFAKGTATIGRGPENDIVLSNDPRVSRQHAEIKQRGNEFVVVNLSQKNFIMVNGENVQSEGLQANSVIQIGDTEIRFLAEAPAVVPTPPPTPVAAAPAPVAPPPILKPMPSQAVTATPRSQSMPAAHGGLPPAAPHMSVPPAMPQPQVGSYGGFPPPPSGAHRGAPVQSGGMLSNPRTRFYGIIVVLGLVAWFILSPNKNKNAKDPNAIRTSAISMQDVAEAEKRTQELLTVKKEKYDSVQYRRAQENFIRGFRDFQQGQYARAREAFQVVLNLDPENELAKRYFHLSKIKFDELVKFNMIQGNRYREKKNWRMCQSNYSNVMTMLQNRRDDPSYKEAKQFYEECSLNLEGGRL